MCCSFTWMPPKTKRGQKDAEEVVEEAPSVKTEPDDGIAQSCHVPSPVPQPQMQHEKRPCRSRHMQTLSVTMSSSQRRQLQRRPDVPAEISLIFQASLCRVRPLLLWAFRSSQWQLQAVFRPRPSLLRVSAAQSRAFGCHLGAEQRQSRSLQPFTAGAVCHSCRHTLCLISIYGSASHTSLSPLLPQ